MEYPKLLEKVGARDVIANNADEEARYRDAGYSFGLPTATEDPKAKADREKAEAKAAEAAKKLAEKEAKAKAKADAKAAKDAAKAAGEAGNASDDDADDESNDE